MVEKRPSWRRPLLVVVVSVLLTTDCVSYFFDGNRLYGFCASDPAAAANFIMGVADTAKWANAGTTVISGEYVEIKTEICLPPGVTSTQARDVVCDALRDNPGSRHEPASGLAWKAMRTVWPCD